MFRDDLNPHWSLWCYGFRLTFSQYGKSEGKWQCLPSFRCNICVGFVFLCFIFYFYAFSSILSKCKCTILKRGRRKRSTAREMILRTTWWQHFRKLVFLCLILHLQPRANNIWRWIWEGRREWKMKRKKSNSFFGIMRACDRRASEWEWVAECRPQQQRPPPEQQQHEWMSAWLKPQTKW